MYPTEYKNYILVFSCIFTGAKFRSIIASTNIEEKNVPYFLWRILTSAFFLEKGKIRVKSRKWIIESTVAKEIYDLYHFYVICVYIKISFCLPVSIMVVFIVLLYFKVILNRFLSLRVVLQYNVISKIKCFDTALIKQIHVLNIFVWSKTISNWLVN